MQLGWARKDLTNLACLRLQLAQMRRSLQLRAEPNPEYVRKLFITPDFTPLEQRKNKALRQQLTEMNKEEKIYRIKNGEIV